jgi:glycosyltransferase involved in cell wall biosynthesis
MDEGFGFPILESQLAGLPLVASDVGSMSEVGGDGLVLIDRDDADKFADALNSLVDPSDQRRQLIEKGRANVNRFSWDRCASEMIALYEEVRSKS